MLQHRTDTAPKALQPLGFNENQDVFLYENTESSTGETALFFTIETYYPDYEGGQMVQDEILYPAIQNYYTYKQKMADQGLEVDPNEDVVIEYERVVKQDNFYGYLHTARMVFSRLLDGVKADDVFEEFQPTTDDVEDWDLFKAAYFDGTGLYMLRNFIDMPRMCANSGIFSKFRSKATPEQIKTIDLLEQPKLFDEHGNYANID